MVAFSQTVVAEFESHAASLREAARARRDAVQLRASVNDSTDGVAVDIKDTLGVRQPGDKWAGCTNLRTLRTLLSMVGMLMNAFNHLLTVTRANSVLPSPPPLLPSR